MNRALLIEIGVEELPAVPLLKIINDIESKWKDILNDNRLMGDFEFLYTPRRLVIRQETIPKYQPDSVEELYGPPVDIALKDGTPTPAGLGFARKCGVSFDELERVNKGGREILYFKREIPGEESAKLLPEMVREWVASMKFGKMMRWGDRDDEFIRPVRWLQIRLDDEVIPAELFGVKSDNKTYLHRMVSSEPVEVERVSDYEDILKRGSVILRPSERREKILNEMAEIAQNSGFGIEEDSELLDEVVAITEYPTALEGRFDKGFLELPPEVIITSMKEHQRYFPVFEGEELANRFVFVTNAVTDDFTPVISGNERVLRPRLADALFFYHNDLKRGLSTDGLEKIQFIDGLGTLADKVERERNIALRLSGIYMDKLKEETSKESLEIERLIERAVNLAKADLLSEMVYEFTELQGIMGYYYAKALGEDDYVALAIKEQYRPEGENAPLPTTLFSSIVSISIKLDTLIGLFSVGKIPSGSRDPFALRRAVNGIVRIIKEYEINFDIEHIIELMRDLYSDFDTKILEDFIIERLYKSIDVNPSLISAVLASGERDILEIFKKVEALNTIVSKDEFRDIFTTFKRVANISKEVDLKSELSVDANLFTEDEEKELWEAFISIQSDKYDSYLEELEALFSLKETLDRFFDNVLVNAEDEAVRNNRRNLVATIYKAFLSIADIKEISI